MCEYVGVGDELIQYPISNKEYPISKSVRRRRIPSRGGQAASGGNTERGTGLLTERAQVREEAAWDPEDL